MSPRQTLSLPALARVASYLLPRPAAGNCIARLPEPRAAVFARSRLRKPHFGALRELMRGVGLECELFLATEFREHFYQFSRNCPRMTDATALSNG